MLFYTANYNTNGSKYFLLEEQIGVPNGFKPIDSIRESFMQSSAGHIVGEGYIEIRSDIMWQVALSTPEFTEHHFTTMWITTDDFPTQYEF